MKHLKTSVLVAAAAGIVGAASLLAVSSSARSERTKTRVSAKIAPISKTSSSRSGAVRKAAPKALPRFLSLQQIKTLREIRNARPKTMPDPLLPVLAPQRLDGKGLPKSLSNLPLLGKKMDEKKFQTLTRTSAQRRTVRRTRGNPSFPAPLPPAVIARAPRTTTPRWVRYPLEFQLAGVGLGTLAVNKDRFNRIDRYGLFAMHGNPTAIVAPIRIPVVENEGGASGGRGGGGQATDSDVAGTADAPRTLTIGQQPPEYSPRFGLSQNGAVPAWANACIVDLDENHVEWLYNRGTYAMGFVVDRLGYVDGIVVAGTQSNIANTQLEDPEHTVRLGDDLRKVLFRYGYPDSFSSYLVTIADGQVSAANQGGGAASGGAASGGAGRGGRGGGGASGGGGAGAGAAAGSADNVTNNVHRIFEVRYEQSYNIVFTIAYNRVIRMYIFGDPDYFNAARRQNLRTSY